MKRLLLLLLFLACRPAFSEGFDLAGRLEVLEDPGGRLSLSDVEHSSFQTSGGIPNFGFTDSAVWIRFQVPPGTEAELLQMGFPLMDRIDLYQKQNGTWTKTTAGMLFPFHHRPHAHRTFLFTLSQESRKGHPVYMRFVNGDSMQIPLTLWTQREFAQNDHDEQFALGIYYGIVFVMALFNLFLFLTLRDRAHLSYVLYVFVFGLFLLSQYGLAYEYLWPEWNHAARRLNPFLASLLEGSILLFTRNFLHTAEHSPAIDKGMRVQIAANAVVMLLAFVLPLSASALLVVGLGLCACAFVLTAAVLALRAGFRPARFFLLAFGFLLLGAATYALKTFGALPVNFFTTNGMQLGSALEVTLLTLALVDRMNALKKETSLAQQRLIEEQKNALVQKESLAASYARLLPGESLALLGKQSITELQPGDQTQRIMSVLFSDIRSFTSLSEQMTPADNFNFLNSYLRRMNPHIRAHNGYIDKYLGDGIMALFAGSSADAIQAAVAMREELTCYNEHRRKSGYAPIQTGTGIHTGPVMLGALGEKERLELTAISDAVNVASRLESLTRTYGASILISETTFQNCENPDAFYYRLLDRVQPRGKTNSIAVYEILSGLPEEEQMRRLETRPIFERGVHAFILEDYAAALVFFQKVTRQDSQDSAASLYEQRSLALLEADSRMYLQRTESVA
jgi:class 3 adenylate cyclase